jgi:hypothetical protein
VHATAEWRGALAFLDGARDRIADHWWCGPAPPSSRPAAPPGLSAASGWRCRPWPTSPQCTR